MALTDQGGTQMPRHTEKLTGKQEAFVIAYVGDARFNATDAARLAGYSGNDATLAVQGSENIRKPKILQAIKARLQDKIGDADRALAEVASIAFDQDHEAKDRLKALHMLLRAFGAFDDKKTITHNVSEGASLMEAAAQIFGFEGGGERAPGEGDDSPVDLEDS